MHPSTAAIAPPTFSTRAGHSASKIEQIKHNSKSSDTINYQANKRATPLA
jgi:hypothetical protein